MALMGRNEEKRLIKKLGLKSKKVIKRKNRRKFTARCPHCKEMRGNDVIVFTGTHKKDYYFSCCTKSRG